MVLREILTEMRPFLNIQRELFIEQVLFKSTREAKTSFISLVSKFHQHQKLELLSELGVTERERESAHIVRDNGLNKRIYQTKSCRIC